LPDRTLSRTHTAIGDEIEITLEPVTVEAAGEAAQA
jgi:hypothetical protein